MTTSQDTTPHAPTMHVKRLGISHGMITWSHVNKLFYHSHRPAWFDGTPIIESKSMMEVHRLVIERGERLYFGDRSNSL